MIIPAWLKWLCALAAVVASVVAYKAWESHVYKQGWNARDVQAKAETLQHDNDALEKLKAATTAADAREKGLLEWIAANDAQRYKENTDHEKTIATLRADARNNALQLRVAIDRNSVSGCATGGNPGTASGLGGEANAVLVPRVAGAVLGIAGQIANDMRRYNALVDRYNAARAACDAVAP